MGLYFRKSVRVGPLRFNFSGAGIGVSAGIPGFRIGTGPRGHYVHAGMGGLYYRSSLGGTRKRVPSATPRVDEAQRQVGGVSESVEIESASALAMSDANSDELLNDMRSRA